MRPYGFAALGRFQNVGEVLGEFGAGQNLSCAGGFGALGEFNLHVGEERDDGRGVSGGAELFDGGDAAGAGIQVNDDEGGGRLLD